MEPRPLAPNPFSRGTIALMPFSAQDPPKPRIVVSVFGAFHHFDLARQLHSQGHLERIFSSFNWGRLQREGLPRELVSTFPLLHPALMLLGRFGVDLQSPRLSRAIFWNQLLLDRWVADRIPACDVVVALSGAGLHTGRRVQERGGRYVCDRGSSHIRFQDRILSEEYQKWGVARAGCDPGVIEREESEYAQCDAITVPSEFARRSFVEMGVAASKVRKVPYGVDLSRFTPVAEPPKDRFEVLFAGQVNLRKGIPYLLEAFQNFPHPNKRLRIIGSVADEIRPLLDRHLPDSVEILGAVRQSELPRIMSSSHVLVLPSIEEGLALVQGQALASGCPVIASTNTGGSDLFTDGVEGFEVPIRSAEAITDKLVQLAVQPELQQQMRAAALERVKSIGGWDDYGRKYLAFLKELTAN
jgi:glycosyltransferase involved in cell wall biosynthesis